MTERGASSEHAPGLFWRQSTDDPTQQLLVNGEGRCYVFAKSTSGKTFVVAYKNGAARFRDSMDYPRRYDWGQAVGVQDFTSGSSLNVQGVRYTITFNRWAAGTEVTISPVPTDWEAEPGPTPPVTPTLFWRDSGLGAVLLVNQAGQVVLTSGTEVQLVVLDDNGMRMYYDSGSYSSLIEEWGSIELLINQPISIVEVDGVVYTFTAEEVGDHEEVSISPEPGTL